MIRELLGQGRSTGYIFISISSDMGVTKLIHGGRGATQRLFARRRQVQLISGFGLIWI